MRAAFEVSFYPVAPGPDFQIALGKREPVAQRNPTESQEDDPSQLKG